mgnify:FL=1
MKLQRELTWHTFSCPGVPAFVESKPPKTRRAAPLQPVPPSTALVHLGPTSAPARIAATQVVALLAMDLLSSFAEHQNYHPAGITVDDIRRSVLGVHGRLEELRGSIKVSLTRRSGVELINQLRRW